jgi:hypothetical protein
MTSFLRRLKYYGIGFSIGLLFVFFFFQNRGCSWLPDNRVKNTILDRVLVIPESEQKILISKGFTNADVIGVLNDGSVSFMDSKRHGDEKIYLVEKDFGEKGTAKLFFTLPNESFLAEVHWADKPVGNIRNTKHGSGSIIHFPNDENLIFIDSSNLTSCQMTALGIHNPVKILNLLKKNGTVNFDQTSYVAKPKPEQYMVFTKNKQQIGVRAIWYKNKINITSFVLPFDTDCD